MTPNLAGQRKLKSKDVKPTSKKKGIESLGGSGLGLTTYLGGRHME